MTPKFPPLDSKGFLRYVLIVGSVFVFSYVLYHLLAPYVIVLLR